MPDQIPSMRGRVIALWQVACQGTTPAGGPAIGWIIAATSPRTGLAVGGASCFVAALGGIAFARRRTLPDKTPARRRDEPDQARETALPVLEGTIPRGAAAVGLRTVKPPPFR